MHPEIDERHCPMEKVYGRNIIKRINDATIIIHEADITLKSNYSMHNNKLEGSYLIQFSERAMSLDGEWFTNINVDIPSKTFIPTTRLKVNSTNLVDRIPLEHLQILYITYRDHIQHLNLTNENIQTRIHILHWLSFGSISVTTLTLIGITLGCIIKTLLTKKATVIIQPGQREVEDTSSGESTPDISMNYTTRHPRFIPL